MLRKGALIGTTDFETRDSEIADVFHTEEEKRHYVKQLVEAMANMTDIADKPGHHHVTAVQATSAAVLEELAWEVYVSPWSTCVPVFQCTELTASSSYRSTHGKFSRDVPGSYPGTPALPGGATQVSTIVWKTFVTCFG